MEKWFYWIFSHWWTRYPASLLMGFLIQSFYLPANSKSPHDGVAMIIFLATGSCVAYYLKWR